MKLFRFGPAGRERPGVLDADGIRRDVSALVEDWYGPFLLPERLADLTPADIAACPTLDEDARIGPCVGGVRNFIAVGLNYAEHAAESGVALPEEPVLFNKTPSCIVGAYDDVHLPPGSVKSDWEVELAVVIGESAWRVSETKAQDVVAGYCICNDLSERAYQLEGTGQWVKGKGCPTFGPLGPWLVTPDEIPDIQNLDMWLEVNGERMQSGSTHTMVFGVYYLISYISRFMRLEPGDVITTGTPPGVGLGMNPPRFLCSSDVMELGISNLGSQRQQVIG